MGDSEETMLKPPCEFGRFLVERELGHGGMGGVYLARDKMLDRQCALKVMLKSYGADPVFVERFKKEAQAAARLIHPNIAQIYSYDILDGQPYIAMEMVSGGSLLKLMEVHKAAIDPHRVMRIGRQVAEGLSCSADQGLVHGDVKPENILLDTAGTAKLVDFGLAAMQNDSDDIWGTPYYIAPEKVRQGPVDWRADMFSLAATLYHALTGQAPFEGTDANEVVKARFMQPAKKPSEVRADLPPELDGIIMKAMAIEVEDRYPTYEGFIGDINRFLSGDLKAVEPVAAPATAGKTGEAGEVDAKPVASGGKKLLVRKKKTMVMRKPSAAKDVPDEDEEASGEGADGEESSENGNPSPAGRKPKLKKRKLVEDGEEEKEGMGAGKMIMLAIVGVIVAVAALVGGLMWYLHSADVSERTEKVSGFRKTQEDARKAVATTVKTARDFVDSLDVITLAAQKTVRNASDEFMRMLDDEQRALVKDVLVPETSKDLDEAIAFTNRLVQARLVAVAQAAAKVAEAVKPAAGATNAAPAAANAPAAASPAAQTAEADPAKPLDPDKPPASFMKDEAGNDIDAADKDAVEAKKKEWKEKALKHNEALKKIAADKKAAEEKKAEAEKKEAEEAEKAKEDAPKPPEALEAFQQLWFDYYVCKAAGIRVRAMLDDVEKIGEKAAAIQPASGLDDEAIAENREAAETLARLSAEAVDKYGAMKDQKIVFDAQKKAGVIKAKAPSLLKTTGLQIKRAREKAEKIKRDKLEAEEKAAQKKAAEEAHKKLAEEEATRMDEAFDNVRSLVKHLSWDLADKQLAALEQELKSFEGKQALKDQRKKIEMMANLHKYLAKQAKGFEFRDRTKITACDEKNVTYQQPPKKIRDPKNPKAKPRTENQKPVTLTWDRFCAKQPGRLNQLINQLVVKGLESRKVTSKLDWSNHMLGAALMLQVAFAEVPGATDRVPGLVKKAVKDFPGCERTAAKYFPDVKLDAEEEDEDEASDKKGAAKKGAKKDAQAKDSE